MNNKPKKKKKPIERKTAQRKSVTDNRPIPEKGEALLEYVVRLTGIPSHAIRKELCGILERKNIDLHHLTLDQLRTVVASYLREIMTNILDRYHPKRPEHHH